MPSGALVADTGGLLRALARKANGKPAWPRFEEALVGASRVLVPSLVLPEIDYFLRGNRPVMRKLIAEIFDPATTYEFEQVTSRDVVRAMVLDGKFPKLGLGLVDGAVAAVAERTKIHRVLTIDHEDFGPLRVGPRYDSALEIVP